MFPGISPVPDEPLIFYMPKWRALGYCVFGLFVIAGAVMAFAHWQAVGFDALRGRNKYMEPFVAIAGVPFGLGILFFYGKRLLHPEPVLVVDREGLSVQLLTKYQIPWTHVDDLAIVEMGRVKILGVIPKEVDALIASHPKGKLFRSQYKTYGALVVVPEKTLPKKLVEIMPQVMVYKPKQATPPPVLDVV